MQHHQLRWTKFFDMQKTYVQIKAEVPQRSEDETDWTLHFQKVSYHYDDGESEDGFRFIWRRPDGTLQAARGQARIPGKKELEELITLAEKEGLFI